MQHIDQLRADTPGCAGKLFFNSAGASLMPRAVVAAMKDHIDLEEQIGGYKAGDVMAPAVAGFYDEIARLVNCNSSNVAFTYNATDSHPTLVAVTHIPTNSGLVQQVEEIGALCRKYEVWYLVDACQSVGQIPVDMVRIGCDFLSATGRKFLRGPRGTGFLCVSDKVISEKLTPLFVDMRGADWTGVDQYEVQPSGKRFETWEFSYASLLGLKAAIHYANQVGIETIRIRNGEMSSSLRERLAAIPRVTVLDRGSQLSSIVTFHIEDAKLDEVCHFLDANRV